MGCCFSVAVFNIWFFKAWAYLPKVRHWIRPWYGLWFCFSIALWAISHLANLQKLATSGTDVKEMKNEKVCQYSQRIQNVAASMYQIWLKVVSPIQVKKKKVFGMIFSCLYGTHQSWTLFQNKINCEKPLCNGIAPSLFANESISRHFCRAQLPYRYLLCKSYPRP